VDDFGRAGFASSLGYADVTDVFSFSPIVLSQYLLKPFRNLLLTICALSYSESCFLLYNSDRFL